MATQTHYVLRSTQPRNRTSFSSAAKSATRTSASSLPCFGGIFSCRMAPGWRRADSSPPPRTYFLVQVRRPRKAAVSVQQQRAWDTTSQRRVRSFHHGTGVPARPRVPLPVSSQSQGLQEGLSKAQWSSGSGMSSLRQITQSLSLSCQSVCNLIKPCLCCLLSRRTRGSCIKHTQTVPALWSL